MRFAILKHCLSKRVRTKAQKSTKERKRNAKNSKESTKGAEECTRALPCKNSKPSMFEVIRFGNSQNYATLAQIKFAPNRKNGKLCKLGGLLIGFIETTWASAKR